MRWAAALLAALVLTPAAAACRPSQKAWVRSSFAQCVRLRESHDGADPNAHGNLYGVQDSSGGYAWAYGVRRTVQDGIAYRMWCRYGVDPWRPYDGC